MDSRAKYTQYAEDVISGRITAGLYIRQACQRYLDWFKRGDLIFRADRADRVVAFIQRFKHYEGKTAGQRFILSDWQRFVIYYIYGFYYKDTPQKRVIRNVYLECARKQGKSMLIAALSLYHLLSDGEGAPQCYCLANSSKQAQLLFTMSKNLIEQLDPNEKIVKTYRDTLKVPALKGIFRALPANVKGLDGLNASFSITDEYAAAENSALYDVLKSSQLQRLNPLNVVITTAGYNLFSPCYQMRATAVEILAGIKTDDTQAAFIYELDENDNWDDPTVWQKSNPNLYVTIDPSDIAAEVNRAKNNQSVRAEVMTKIINIWLQSAETWIGADVVNRATATVDLEQYRGSTVYLGVDLASVSDLTAVSLLIPESDGNLVFKTWYFLPSESLTDTPNRQTYLRYQRNGMLHTTPGNVTDYDYILTLILDLQKRYDFYIAGIYYDTYNATQFAISATENGLPMIPYSQSIGSFNKPTKEFERLIKSGHVTLDNNDITRWCIGNVAIKSDWNDNSKPVKGKSKYDKIDGVISMIQALGGYLTTERYDNQIGI